MSKDYSKANDDKDLSNTRVPGAEKSIANESTSRRDNEDLDTGTNLPRTPKQNPTMGSSVTGDSSASVSGPQDGSSRGLTSRADLGGLPAAALANPDKRDNEPMGGLGGRTESKAGEKESDQQQLGGTTIDNQGDNPALR